MYAVKSCCAYILSALYMLVKLVKCLFLFLLPDFILMNNDFQYGIYNTMHCVTGVHLDRMRSK